MSEIILNERTWVQSALANNVMGDKPGEALMRVARYYHDVGYKRREIERLLEEFMLRCDPSVCIYKWSSWISRCAATAEKYHLVEVCGVGLAADEMQVVQNSGGCMAQRLLFTLMCLAKYGNAVNPRNKNWVNRSPREIFALANIKLTTNRQSLMINDLWQAGYVGYSGIVDNINLNVKCISSDSSKPVIFITDFRNLGNQYRRFCGEDYIECQHCGIVIKRTSGRQKYCSECAAEINIRNTSRNRNSAA